MARNRSLRLLADLLSRRPGLVSLAAVSGALWMLAAAVLNWAITPS